MSLVMCYNLINPRFIWKQWYSHRLLLCSVKILHGNPQEKDSYTVRQVLAAASSVNIKYTLISEDNMLIRQTEQRKIIEPETRKTRS